LFFEFFLFLVFKSALLRIVAGQNKQKFFSERQMRASVFWALWLSYVLLCVAFYPPRPLPPFAVLCRLECVDTADYWVLPCFVARHNARTRAGGCSVTVLAAE
jgi:hypothetical protein